MRTVDARSMFLLYSRDLDFLNDLKCSLSNVCYILYKNNINKNEKTLKKLKALKCKPSAEFGGNIGIFGLKTPLYAYVLGKHTSMKNEL